MKQIGDYKFCFFFTFWFEEYFLQKNSIFLGGVLEITSSMQSHANVNALFDLKSF